MKQVNFLFLISVRQAVAAAIPIKFLLCCLIPFGIATMIGCDMDRDMEDLSDKPITLSFLSDKVTLAPRQAIKLSVSVGYEEDHVELKYHWKPTAGEIYGTGKHVIYVAPKDEGSHSIILQVSNGIITESEFITLEVKKVEEDKEIEED